MTEERKPRILVVGSFNMDLTGIAGRLPLMGETVIGKVFKTAPGGKGSNQAIQCARLGAEVTMVGCVGKDAFGEELLSAHRDAGVDVSHVKISGDTPTGVALIEVEQAPGKSQNRILVIPGANDRILPEDLDWLKEEMGNFDIVLLQLEIPLETNVFVAETAFWAGVPVMLNPAPARTLPPELLRKLDYLSPNETESALLTRLGMEKTGDEEGLKAISDALLSQGVKRVLITLGERGCLLAGPGGTLREQAVKMEAVKDPTAAGDSFVAAFCTRLAGGAGEQEALSFASHAAALTVCKEGALPSLPSLEEVEELIRSGKN